MLRILESQAPAKQTATDTINTLSSRLSSATLLEDRRAAILGLRSFAKQFPASVASGALRDLLAALRKDGEDSDTTKVVLETLLMLFEPDETSPEASEEITLWLADEFTQRQDNITALLDLLETGEFYLRLYSLQILSHVCAARPQRAHEAVLAAPLGVSRITAVLDERREAVRNEALLLLVALTPASAELQKVVAFENAFEKVFALIQSEGGLTHGSTIVQDCLSLLANLLTLNTLNQSYFRESGCVSKLAGLLLDVIREEESPDGLSDWIRPQRDMNLWGLLAVIQLFLVRGSQGTMEAQTAFQQSKVLVRVLQIAFHQSFGTNVRSKSLDTCGDIIRGNSGLQEQFGDLAVPLIRQQVKPVVANGHKSPAPDRRLGSTTGTPAPVEATNVIEALLELTLAPASLSMFDVRLAACSCMKAFIEGHKGIKGHVLRRAIEGHRSGADAIPNMLTVLLEPSSMRSNSDPYQVWMASVLLMHILYEDPDAKSLAGRITEGNAEDGEELVTFIQSITSNIVAGVQHVEDERALLGHLMLLTTWLYEDPDAVNDLLGEGSNVQGLIAAIKVSSTTMPLVAGLCALLLGIMYEFSTRDSPIPRSTLHGVLNRSLTREVYIDRLTKLRESPFVRDFEVISPSSNAGLPDVYFDKTFMDFLKDNFSRILRAIDRDPNFESSFVSNGVRKGISRELVDSLRGEVEEQRQSLESAQAEVLQLRQKLQQEELEHKRTKESTTVELGRIKHINNSLQQNHEEESVQLQQDHARQLDKLVRNHETAMTQLRKDHLAAVEDFTKRHQAEKKYLEQRQSGHERELARVKEHMSAQHKAEIDRVTSEADRVQEQIRYQLETIQKKLDEAHKAQSQSADQLEMTHRMLEEARSQLSQKQKDFDSQAQKIREEYTEKLKIAESSTKQAGMKIVSAETRLQETESRLAAAESLVKQVQETLTKTEARAKRAEESAASKLDPKVDNRVKELQREVERLQSSASKAKDVQTELDDLLVVFADLEAKRAIDKKRLKDLGEEVSEDEDGDDEDENENGDSNDDSGEDDED